MYLVQFSFVSDVQISFVSDAFVFVSISNYVPGTNFVGFRMALNPLTPHWLENIAPGTDFVYLRMWSRLGFGWISRKT